jgi:hypothetical protein
MEPVYVYVKGQGWVPTTYPVFTMRCGTVVQVIPKVPEEGQAYSYVMKHRAEKPWVLNGELNLQAFVDHYKNYRYTPLGRFVSQEWDEHSIKSRHWVTIVMLERPTS